MICAAILSPVVVVLRTVIQVARQIVHTVCEWVSSTITTIRTVVEEVCNWVRENICSWLPWPFNRLCEWVNRLVCTIVTTTLQVIETAWNWVCHEVIERILEWVEIFFEYVFYILKWICWAIDWIIRLPELGLCALGVRLPKFMGVCVKILADDAGNPAIPLADVQAMMRDAAAIFRRCNIRLVICSTEIVIKPEFLDSTVCEFSGMFSRFFSWFSTHACGCCSTVTVYFVRDIVAASGCAYPGSDWVTVDAAGDGTVVVQEIGHLCDLWEHSSDPNNVMTDVGGGTHDQITAWQCCMIRSSRFAKLAPPCDLLSLAADRLTARLKASVGEPFKRKDRGRP